MPVRRVAVVVVAIVAAVDPWGYAPFGPLRAAVALAGSFALAASVVHGAGPTMSARGRLAVAGCAVWLVVAAWRGVDAGHAVWGTPERHLGLVSIAGFGAAVWSGWRMACRGRGAVDAIGRAAVVAAGVIAGWTVLQWTDVIDLGVTGSGRLGGPFGSPAYCGAAVVLLAPLVAGVAFDRSAVKRWRGSAGCALAALAGVLAGTSSRAAFVGVVGELVAAWFVLARRRPRRAGAEGAGAGATGRQPTTRLRRIRRGAVFAGAALMMPAIVAVGPRFADGGGGRWAEWRTGLRAVADHPVFGLGPEGYRVAFPGVVDGDYVARFGRDVVTDRAHNVGLDAALLGGIPLGAALLGALLWGVVTAVRVVRSSSAAPSERAVALSVVGIVIHHQFLFLTVELDVATCLVGGLVLGTWQRFAAVDVDVAVFRRPATATRRSAPATFVAAGLAIVAVGVAIVGSAEIVADRRVAAALADGGSLDRAERLARADRAAAVAPWSMRAHLAAATVAAEAGTASDLRVALDRLAGARRISPDDPYLRLRDATWWSEIAAQENEAEGLADAIGRWLRLLDADPLLPDGWVGLGRARAVAGDDRGSDEAFRRAVALVPNDARPGAAWAATQASRGRLAEASSTADAALAVDPHSADARAAVDLVAALSRTSGEAGGESDGSR